MSLEVLDKYKDQLLRQVNQFRASNEHFKVIEEYFTGTDRQTYNIIGITTVTIFSMWLLEKILKGSNGSSNATKSQKKRRKKKAGALKKKNAVQEPVLSPMEKSTAQIDRVMKDMEETVIPEFDLFKAKVENGGFNKEYKKQTSEDPDYMILYFNEVLLKKVMELDGVDTLGDDSLRLRRKQSVKFIQDYHRQVDELKKKLKK